MRNARKGLFSAELRESLFRLSAPCAEVQLRLQMFGKGCKSSGPGSLSGKMAWHFFSMSLPMDSGISFRTFIEAVARLSGRFWDFGFNNEPLVA